LFGIAFAFCALCSLLGFAPDYKREPTLAVNRNLDDLPGPLKSKIHSSVAFPGEAL